MRRFRVGGREVRRRTFSLLTALCLVPCLAVVGLWPRSYRVTDFIGWSDDGRFVGALSMHGLIRLEYGSYPAGAPGWSYVSYATPGGAEPGLWGEVRARDRGGGWLRPVGIAYATVDYVADGSRRRRALYLPHWLFAAVAALAPAWRLRHALRSRRRLAAGRCPACGYDLTGNTSGVCPECGTTCRGTRPPELSHAPCD